MRNANQSGDRHPRNTGIEAIAKECQSNSKIKVGSMGSIGNESPLLDGECMSLSGIPVWHSRIEIGREHKNIWIPTHDDSIV